MIKKEGRYVDVGEGNTSHWVGGGQMDFVVLVSQGHRKQFLTGPAKSAHGNFTNIFNIHELSNSFPLYNTARNI